ncbi:MAG: glycine cleavage system protein H [Chloroflexi bacterium]|jgi:glycine cleavage system H protein|nr:glycine cleavage system protein H [Anaerolineaceae bacterium]NLI44358.1 glycine cleavage system protein H [Chloroflexota bacterium]HOT25403.1 glycine cleavage system protein H [Anaerolineaceae bacterium]HQH57389.1 glycine cleavage system protein H [Anaerolineaceae bacterium]HQK03305.1 glycine cleavage system protein H [Anaerolineaceae bacterium]
MFDTLEFTIDKFTFRVRTDRLYTDEGLWVLEQDGTLRIGLSDYLQQHSGDVAFVDARPVGTRLAAGDTLFTIETIKVTSDLHSPAAGVISAVNPDMVTAPEKVNSQPYEEGWVCELSPESWESARTQLLRPETYFEKIQQDAAKELEKDGD